MIQAQVKRSRAGFDKGGKILDFPVSILMVGVGWLVGDANREKREDRSDQIKPGMCRLGENAQATGGDSHHDLQAGDDQRRQVQSFPPRRASRRASTQETDCWAAGHGGIIAGRAESDKKISPQSRIAPLRQDAIDARRASPATVG